ncbi:hypothetical protein GCM10022217_15050 [Chryseobacterium ginsenosidimutans]
MFAFLFSNEHIDRPVCSTPKTWISWCIVSGYIYLYKIGISCCCAGEPKMLGAVAPVVFDIKKLFLEFAAIEILDGRNAPGVTLIK